MNHTNLKYICNELLEVEWEPIIATNDLRILDKCGSKLECMFLLGAFHFLEEVCRKSNSMAIGEYAINKSEAIYNDSSVEGFCFYGVWPLWFEILGEDVGPQSVLFVPQLPFANDYHHDFGIFYGDKNCAPEKWSLRYAVEIDGYKVHKDRRGKDKYRDSLVIRQGNGVVDLVSVLIIYDSRSGSTEKAAILVAEGVRQIAGVECSLKKVDDVVSKELLTSRPL